MQGLCQKRIDKFIKVTDDWYPCYKDNQVKISLFISYLDKINYHFVRICVWGYGNFGLEMDYDDTDYNRLISKYNEWKADIFDKVQSGTDKDWFINLGFYEA